VFALYFSPKARFSITWQPPIDISSIIASFQPAVSYLGLIPLTTITGEQIQQKKYYLGKQKR
jgi:hypothetical protein